MIALAEINSDPKKNMAILSKNLDYGRKYQASIASSLDSPINCVSGLFVLFVASTGLHRC